MNFGKLLGERKIEREENFSLEQPMKDLEFAGQGLKTKNYSRVMALVYEAVLMAGNELMHYSGYRAIGKEHHKHVFEFLKESNIDEKLVRYFDIIRIKRNNFIYRGADEIGKSEVEEILEKGREFVQKIRTHGN